MSEMVHGWVLSPNTNLSVDGVWHECHPSLKTMRTTFEAPVRTNGLYTLEHSQASDHKKCRLMYVSCIPATPEAYDKQDTGSITGLPCKSVRIEWILSEKDTTFLIEKLTGFLVNRAKEVDSRTIFGMKSASDEFNGAFPSACQALAWDRLYSARFDLAHRINIQIASLACIKKNIKDITSEDPDHFDIVARTNWFFERLARNIHKVNEAVLTDSLL